MNLRRLPIRPKGQGARSEVTRFRRDDLDLQRCLVVVCLVIAMASACSFGQDREAAGHAVERIRGQIAAADYAGIYREASKEARALTTELELRTVFGAVRDLGVPTAARQTSWVVRVEPGRTLVTLEFATTFAAMPQLIETFILVSEDNSFRLLGYDNNLP